MPAALRPGKGLSSGGPEEVIFMRISARLESGTAAVVGPFLFEDVFPTAEQKSVGNQNSQQISLGGDNRIEIAPHRRIQIQS